MLEKHFCAALLIWVVRAEFHFWDHSLHGLERLEGFSSTDVRPFELSNEPIKISSTIDVRRLLWRMHATVEITASASKSVQKPCSKLHGDFPVASGSRKKIV